MFHPTHHGTNRLFADYVCHWTCASWWVVLYYVDIHVLTSIRCLSLWTCSCVLEMEGWPQGRLVVFRCNVNSGNLWLLLILGWKKPQKLKALKFNLNEFFTTAMIYNLLKPGLIKLQRKLNGKISNTKVSGIMVLVIIYCTNAIFLRRESNNKSSASHSLSRLSSIGILVNNFMLDRTASLSAMYFSMSLW